MSKKGLLTLNLLYELKRLINFKLIIRVKKAYKSYFMFKVHVVHDLFTHIISLKLISLLI